MKLLERQVCYGRSVFVLLLLFVPMLSARLPLDKKEEQQHPKIVNIINFVRLLEPRYNGRITEDILYQTVVNQLGMMRAHNLGGTFLLQYDALIDSRYQKLLKNLPKEYEIGGWWEIPQPLAEKAGLKWRGRFPWDWHVNVGFSLGYTPEERMKLVDVYFEDFKKIFGCYPKSVGSWFIDEVTLNYMYEKYGIVASCNCRDQIGTDGYTLWGGYWNQAYYPSKVNAYMPAQNSKNQIPVPIFRMLGSDHIREYDDGIKGAERNIYWTLEPYIKNAGGDSTWVNWTFMQFVEGACLNFAYIQAGQENSFTWEKIKPGYKIQMPLISKLRDENKIKVETLSESGKWFRDNFKVTPPTSVTVMDNFKNDERKTVWFNSRFYRSNIIWENNTLRIRDIHLFNEKLPSDYLTEKTDLSTCNYYTLPFIDGNMWSDSSHHAGLRLKTILNGKEVLIEGGTPVVTNFKKGMLHVSWPLKNVDGNFIVDFNECGVNMKLESKKSIEWFLDLTTAVEAKLPITKISSCRIQSKVNKLLYSVNVVKGLATIPVNGIVFRLAPEKGIISLDFSKR
jgi:hypothetical protein